MIFSTSESTRLDADTDAVTATRSVSSTSLLSSRCNVSPQPAKPCNSSARICASSGCQQVTDSRYSDASSPPTIGCRFTNMTIGRSRRFTTKTKMVAMAA